MSTIMADTGYENGSEGLVLQWAGARAVRRRDEKCAVRRRRRS